MATHRRASAGSDEGPTSSQRSGVGMAGLSGIGRPGRRR